MAKYNATERSKITRSAREAAPGYKERQAERYKIYSADPDYKERRRANMKERYKKPEIKARARVWELNRRYGMTPQEYADMVASQGGVCAICETAPKNGRALHVDHDHSDGSVRGALCGRCNTALGGFQDKIERLGIAINYLRKHKANLTKRFGYAPKLKLVAK